jgi:5-(carboxyamino)imidazole ribonucleotide synthase
LILVIKKIGSKLENRTRIGILGGGQLARMSAIAAYRMGFEISILEKKKESPAGQLTHNEYVGWVDDDNVLEKFVQSSDIITLENEFIDSEKLKKIENMGVTVTPSSKTLSLIQDKLIQKNTFFNNDLPVPEYVKIDSQNDYQKVADKLGSHFVIKSRKMGYDGYGNAEVNDESDFKEAYQNLTSRHSELYAEEFVDFDKELAVMIARSNDQVKAYPVVHTIQKNHICHTVIAPAEVNDHRIIEKVKEIGIEAVKSVDGLGIFGIEFFLTKSGAILINEIAPRPHNTGHYTIEGCITSQFSNHIRAVLNLPLGSTELVKPHAVMINLLGKFEGSGVVENYQDALSEDDVHLHIYNKDKSRVGRKMGHITIIGDDSADILERAEQLEKQIKI